MSKDQVFKIDRNQRIHHHGLVVRVYQVFGESRYGWDGNKPDSPFDPSLYDSREAAELAADAALNSAGHQCTEACYAWRALM